MARALLSHGVTSFLPTAPSLPAAELPALADRARAWMPAAPADGAEPLGFNLEGPFLAPARRGAHDPSVPRCLGSWPAQALAPWTPGAYHRLPANRRVSIVASVSVGGPSPVDGPRSGKRPYDPRRLRTPGIRPVRQAHCVALHAAGIRVEPGWVVGVLLAVALLSTRIVAGSTSGSAAPTAASIEANLARFYAAASSVPIASADPVGESLGDVSGGVTHSASPAVASATPRPKATPRPTADPAPEGDAPTNADPAPEGDAPSDRRPREEAGRPGDRGADAAPGSHSEADAGDRVSIPGHRAGHLGRFRRRRDHAPAAGNPHPHLRQPRLLGGRVIRKRPVSRRRQPRRPRRSRLPARLRPAGHRGRIDRAELALTGSRPRSTPAPGAPPTPGRRTRRAGP